MGHIGITMEFRVWIAMNELHLPHRQREASSSRVAALLLDAIGAFTDFTPLFATSPLSTNNRSLELYVVTVQRALLHFKAAGKSGIALCNR